MSQSCLDTVGIGKGEWLVSGLWMEFTLPIADAHPLSGCISPLKLLLPWDDVHVPFWPVRIFHFAIWLVISPTAASFFNWRLRHWGKVIHGVEIEVADLSVINLNVVGPDWGIDFLQPRTGIGVTCLVAEKFHLNDVVMPVWSRHLGIPSQYDDIITKMFRRWQMFTCYSHMIKTLISLRIIALSLFDIGKSWFCRVVLYSAV